MVLGADGTITQVLSRDGEALPDAVRALRGAVHGIALPGDAPPFLVVPAVTRCEGGQSSAVLGPAEQPDDLHP